MESTLPFMWGEVYEILDSSHYISCTAGIDRTGLPTSRFNGRMGEVTCFEASIRLWRLINFSSGTLRVACLKWIHCEVCDSVNLFIDMQKLFICTSSQYGKAPGVACRTSKLIHKSIWVFRKTFKCVCSFQFPIQGFEFIWPVYCSYQVLN